MAIMYCPIKLYNGDDEERKTANIGYSKVKNSESLNPDQDCDVLLDGNSPSHETNTNQHTNIIYYNQEQFSNLAYNEDNRCRQLDVCDEGKNNSFCIVECWNQYQFNMLHSFMTMAIISQFYTEIIEFLPKILYNICIDRLEHVLGWLMRWPVGLKLEPNLARFIGNLFIWIIWGWKSNVKMMSCLCFLVKFCCMLSPLGFKWCLAVFIDGLWILNSHLYLLQKLSKRLFWAHIRPLYSLLNIFRGRKWNTLRERVDIHEFDVDQLLLGVVLGCVGGALLPTVSCFMIVLSLSESILVIICEMVKWFLFNTPISTVNSTYLQIKEETSEVTHANTLLLTLHPNIRKMYKKLHVFKAIKNVFLP